MVVEARGRALKSADGEFHQAVFIARDISTNIAAEADLAESRETTRAILDAATDSIIVIDRNLIILEASPGTQHLHGVPASDRVGRFVTEFVVEDDREFVERSFRTAFERDEAVALRCQMNHRDGHVVTLEVRGRTVRDGVGPPSRLVFISRDITESVAWEVALARSFSKTKAILDAAPDSIIVVDRKLNILEASPGTERTYGYPKEERMGQNALAIMHPDDVERVSAELERLFAQGNDELMSYRFRARHADGRWLIIETRGRLLRDEDGESHRAVLVSRDVSDTVGAEEALAAAKEEAERANAAKSEFMSRMSHELRTPLNSVLGFAQILQMELQSSDDLELVDHVYKSGQHLLTLINEVLDISRVESGHDRSDPRVSQPCTRWWPSALTSLRHRPRSAASTLDSTILSTTRRGRPLAPEAGDIESSVKRNQVQPQRRQRHYRVQSHEAQRYGSQYRTRAFGIAPDSTRATLHGLRSPRR
jgi:PAS domain S-box-containing protein